MQFKIKRKLVYLLIFPVAVIAFSSCKKYVDAGAPVTLLTPDKVFSDSLATLGAVMALYSNGNINSTQPASAGLILNMSQMGAMTADEGYFYNDAYNAQYSTNALNANLALAVYSVPYQVVNMANKNIEGIAGSTALSAGLKSQLIGECEFWRAYAYFYLINYFGNVPLVITTNVPANATLARSPVADVYKQILADLTDAKGRLSATYPSAERARINKWTASALLARVYLYQKDWVNAEAEAANVIGSGTYSLEPNLANVFIKTSNEIIWQTVSLTPTAGVTGVTQMGRFWIPSGTVPLFVLYDTLPKTFETNDQRKTNWTKSIVYNSTTWYYPYKYKIRLTSASGNEYNVMFRLAEQYLIRSEARAMQNNFSGAQADLNAVRNRAGLANTTAATQADLLTALEHERWVELFTEMGDRWFNLRRTGRIDVVMKATKPNWQPYEALYPIPTSELTANPQLKQNSGY